MLLNPHNKALQRTKNSLLFSFLNILTNNFLPLNEALECKGVLVQDNIKQFDEVAAIIFSHLYDQFPSPSGMEMHKLVGGKIDTDNLYICPKTNFSKHVVNWLTEEGFIKSSGGNFAMYNQCVLTAKGLDALNATPESLGGKETVISKLKSGLATGSSEVIKSAISASVKALVAQAL